MSSKRDRCVPWGVVYSELTNRRRCKGASDVWRTSAKRDSRSRTSDSLSLSVLSVHDAAVDGEDDPDGDSDADEEEDEEEEEEDEEEDVGVVACSTGAES